MGKFNLKNIIILIILILSLHTAHASQFVLHTGILEDLKAVVGNYKGDIRLQSADGVTNRPLVSNAQVELSISGDQLILKPHSDLVGKECRSQVGGVRELFKSPQGPVLILRAEFDFNSKSCLSYSKFNALLVLLERGSGGDLTMETLLVQSSQGRDTFYPVNRGTSVHGYLTKIDGGEGKIMSRVATDAAPPN